MRKILFLMTLVFFFLLPQATFGACDYYELMLDCKQKNDRGKPHVTEDYLCIQSVDDQEILYNIILDREFSVIDTQAYDFLKWLETTKNYFFGSSANASYFQGIELIGLKFGKNGEYWQMYNDVCDVSKENSVNNQVLSCISEETGTNAKVLIDNARNYFEGSSCMGLAETKLDIYENIANDILKINKANVRKDNRKRFMQNQRVKYDYLLDSMRINVGFLERIWKKWTSKTKNAY